MLLMFCMLKMKINILCMFQNITQHEEQVIFLMIPNKEGWHYILVIKISSLLRGITSMHSGDYYCLNCLNLFRTKNRLEYHKKIYENKDFCIVVMPSEDTKILEFNQYRESDKALFIIYPDLESLTVKIDG